MENELFHYHFAAVNTELSLQFNLKTIYLCCKSENMIAENFVMDFKGRKIAVQVPIKRYEQLLADSEELEEIKEYRKAKQHSGKAIPFEQAFKEIEHSKK
ncbi:MAG: hypothetical protein RIQ33_742 [Bacteroidota bacterium]|jgi:hypothetical protein